MLLLDLPTAIRSVGLVCEEAPNWRTHNHGPLTAFKAILCHHTAGPKVGDYPSYNAVRNGIPGLPGPLAALGLARSGKVIVFSSGRTYHAGVVKNTAYSNNNSLGIEAEATGVDTWPQVQYDAYVALCWALSQHYHIPVEMIVGHKEACAPAGRKIDPNFDMNTFRNNVRSYRKGVTTPPPAKKRIEAMMNDTPITGTGKRVYSVESGGGGSVNPNGSAWVCVGSAIAGTHFAVNYWSNSTLLRRDELYVKANGNDGRNAPKSTRLVVLEYATEPNALASCSIFHV